VGSNTTISFNSLVFLKSAQVLYRIKPQATCLSALHTHSTKAKKKPTGLSEVPRRKMPLAQKLSGPEKNLRLAAQLLP